MLPRFPINDISYILLSHIECQGDLLVGLPFGAPSPYLDNVGIGQFRAAVAFSPRYLFWVARPHVPFPARYALWVYSLAVFVAKARSAFSNHISRIVRVGSEKQMFKVAARWAIAAMAYLQFKRIDSGGQKIGNSTRAIWPLIHIELSISALRAMPSPRPAFILASPINEFVKALYVMLGHWRDLLCSTEFRSGNHACFTILHSAHEVKA